MTPEKSKERATNLLNFWLQADARGPMFQNTLTNKNSSCRIDLIERIASAIKLAYDEGYTEGYHDGDLM